MSQRLDCILGICHSPRFVIYAVSGLREWDLALVGDFPPRMFTAEPVRRLRGDSAGQFTPHHILEWGAKTAFTDALLVV